MEIKIKSEVINNMDSFQFWYTEVKNILCDKLGVKRNNIRIPSDLITLCYYDNDVEITNSYKYDMEEWINEHGFENAYYLKLECITKNKKGGK